MMQTEYSIGGMTCQNCVRHVGDALRELPGVNAVAVDLDSGHAQVASDDTLSRDAVAAALTEAGYDLL